MHVVNTSLSDLHYAFRQRGFQSTHLEGDALNKIGRDAGEQIQNGKQ